MTIMASIEKLLRINVCLHVAVIVRDVHYDVASRQAIVLFQEDWCGIDGLGNFLSAPGRIDVISQLEADGAWIGWHGSTLSG